MKRETKRLETQKENSMNGTINEGENEEICSELKDIAYNIHSFDLYKRACCMKDSKVCVARVMWYLKNMNETLLYYANINQNNQFFVNITTMKGENFKCAINVEDCKTVDGRCKIMKIIEQIVFDKLDPVDVIEIDSSSITRNERRITRQSIYSARREFDSEESYEEESYEESSTENDGNQEKVTDAVETILDISQSDEKKKKKKKKGVKRVRIVNDDEDYELDGVRSKRLREERRERMVMLNKKQQEEKEKEEEKKKKKKKGKKKSNKRKSDKNSKDDNEEECNKCFDYGDFITCFGNPENPDIDSQSTDIEKDYIDNMPTYRGLVYTLLDLYTVRYARKKRKYRAFSYGATGYLLDHITTTNMTSGELYDRLIYYMGYNKFSKVLRRRKREDIKGLQVLRCIHVLSKLDLGFSS